MKPKDYRLDEDGLRPIAHQTLTKDVQIQVAIAWSERRALILNANKPGYSEAFTIEAEQYTLIRTAIFQAIELFQNENGETLLKDIVKFVQENLGNHARFPKGRMTNYTRYTKTDLEARGELERIPKSSPQMVRLPTKNN